MNPRLSIDENQRRLDEAVAAHERLALRMERASWPQGEPEPVEDAAETAWKETLLRPREGPLTAMQAEARAYREREAREWDEATQRRLNNLDEPTPAVGRKSK